MISWSYSADKIKIISAGCFGYLKICVGIYYLVIM